MPNWCCNTVEFHADGTVLKAIGTFFADMSKKAVRTMQGQLPDFFSGQSGWLFEIDMLDDILYYQTKWCPNVEVMICIARHFKCGFTLTYDEPGMLLYGEFSYKDGRLQERSIEEVEREQLQFIEENYTYLFEGIYYDSEYEIYEILLERKEWKDVVL